MVNEQVFPPCSIPGLRSQGHPGWLELRGAAASGQNCHPLGEILCPLSPPGNGTQLRRQSHFSRCPEEFQHYCVKGRCRFLVAEQAPACV